MFKRISIWMARKRFNAGETITLCPIKLRPGFPFAPHITLHSDQIREMIAESHGDKDAAWSRFLCHWNYCNSSHETGYYPAYYIES